MLIKDKKIAFIHIPKTWWTTIEKIFDVDTSQEPPPWWKHQRLQDIGYRKVSFINVRYIPQKKLEKYFKFSFVRNPWDWCLAHYLYHKSRFPHLVPETFDDFIINHISPFSFPAAWMYRAYWTQLSYITNSVGFIGVDFLWRFENFEEDLGKVLSNLNLQSGDIPHMNRTEERDYTRYYTKATEGVIASRYKSDIDTFNYSFWN